MGTLSCVKLPLLKWSLVELSLLELPLLELSLFKRWERKRLSVGSPAKGDPLALEKGVALFFRYQPRIMSGTLFCCEKFMESARAFLEQA